MNDETKVTIEKVTKIQNLEEAGVCDNGHAFIVKQALLVPFVNDANDLGAVMYVDNEYSLKLGSNYKQKELSGYLLACPICKVVHLSGFNPPSNNPTMYNGEDNTLQERALSPEL